MNALSVSASDLAPGDLRAARLDFGAFSVREIMSADDPHFSPAYDLLAAEFGSGKGLELPEAIAQRFAWRNGMRYALFLVRDQAGEIAAVRDHTAIVSAERGEMTIHLSHLFVAPRWRRTGLAGWMRALPLQTARACSPGLTPPSTLVAEMDGGNQLRAYARAGFRQVDPEAVQYYQPDFRSAAEIAVAGVRPLPYSLVLRQVGREAAETISVPALRRLVQNLYRMYGQTCAHLPSLAGFPPDDAPPIRLRVPRFE